MDKASSSPAVCSGESRSYVDMEGTLKDFSSLFEKRLSQPGKQGPGHRLTLTNDQEWFLWMLKDHCTQRQLAEDLQICRDKVIQHKKRLEEQGGPKGEKPAWMK